MQDLLIPLILFAAAMCLRPGPNVVMVTASAANFGFRRTIPQILGITFGFAIMIMAAGLGLAGLFRAEPRLHLVLKYVGAIYLCYLAWRIAVPIPGAPAGRRRDRSTSSRRCCSLCCTRGTVNNRAITDPLPEPSPSLSSVSEDFAPKQDMRQCIQPVLEAVLGPCERADKAFSTLSIV
jgi:arginine exporter protein ArgO